MLRCHSIRLSREWYSGIVGVCETKEEWYVWGHFWCLSIVGVGGECFLQILAVLSSLPCPKVEWLSQIQTSNTPTHTPPHTQIRTNIFTLPLTCIHILTRMAAIWNEIGTTHSSPSCSFAPPRQRVEWVHFWLIPPSPFSSLPPTTTSITQPHPSLP